MTEEKKSPLHSCKQGFEELQKELETTKALAEEYLNGWKRAKADLVNFQKEADGQKGELVNFCTNGFILSMLPIYESLEKSIESIKNFHPHPTSPSASGGGGEEGEAIVQGVGNIKKQFDDLFKNLGVEKIKTVGEKFDPNFHESVGVEESKEKSGTIIKEIQSGCMMNGKVIRAAKVITAE